MDDEAAMPTPNSIRDSTLQERRDHDVRLEQGQGLLAHRVVDIELHRDLVAQGAQLDEETLRQVADITGGQYFRAEDTAGLRDIYDAINEMEQSQVEVQVYNQYFELAGYLLVPALLSFLIELFLRHTTFRKIP